VRVLGGRRGDDEGREVEDGRHQQGTTFAVKKTTSRHKQTFEPRYGPTSGTMDVIAKTDGRRPSYEWRHRADDVKTSVDVGYTLRAKTTVNGLLAANDVSFRCRAMTKKAPRDWIAPASIHIEWRDLWERTLDRCLVRLSRRRNRFDASRR
jgi:hypothetical protein